MSAEKRFYAILFLCLISFSFQNEHDNWTIYNNSIIINSYVSGLTEEERDKLEEAPVDEPSDEFLQFLVVLKEKYLNELDMSSETAFEGNNEPLISWLDEVISFTKQREENAYEDPDTFITANLEAIYGLNLSIITPIRPAPTNARIILDRSPLRRKEMTRKVAKKMIAVPKSPMIARQPRQKILNPMKRYRLFFSCSSSSVAAPT